ncbi:MAG: replication-relaxation family protein [Actinobacteria bacterium]|nr:replication-relaxation family protein [Actinomycetota bacterium]
MGAEHPLLRAQASLTDRDLRLLGWLYDHGVLTTPQIASALFSSLDFAQRRLLRLLNLGVVARFRPQRFDGGSYPYHYLADQLGTDIIAAQRGDAPPRRDQARRRRAHLTSRANLPHLLGTNQIFIDLATHERTHAGARLVRWWPPAAFHTSTGYYQDGDNPQVLATRLPRPDGHGIWVDGDQMVAFFVEYDTGSERLDTLTTKIRRYTALVELTGRDWPVLLWLPGTRRELHLHQTLATSRTPATGGGAGVTVATATGEHTTHTARTAADAVWWLHGRQGDRLHLADLPHTSPDAETMTTLHPDPTIYLP